MSKEISIKDQLSSKELFEAFKQQLKNSLRIDRNGWTEITNIHASTFVGSSF